MRQRRRPPPSPPLQLSPHAPAEPDPNAAPWRRQDVLRLRQALRDWALTQRALEPDVDREEAIAAAVRDRPRDVILAELRGDMARWSRQYAEACQTIGNQLVRFTAPEAAAGDEIVQHFRKLAQDYDHRVREAERLMLRVLREGLPPGVVDE